MAKVGEFGELPRQHTIPVGDVGVKPSGRPGQASAIGFPRIQSFCMLVSLFRYGYETRSFFLLFFLFILLGIFPSFLHDFRTVAR